MPHTLRTFHLEDNYRLAHSFYLDLAKMVAKGLDPKAAHRMLGPILRFKNAWRVVGVSENALQAFAKANFLTHSYQGIQRCHLGNRQVRNIAWLLNPILDPHLWYQDWLANDKTVLALSGENKAMYTGLPVHIHWFDNQESLGTLFETSGYKWRHKAEEQQCLECLYAITR